MPSKTLYLIDGHSQIYRAYYAPFGNLSSPTGEPTRAVHVFIQMLLNMLRDRKPDYLAMALDVSDETVFRVQIDPTYKQNREASPEDLGPQIDRIVTIVEAMGIPILRLPGFEADDILATLSARLASPELDVYLVSRDKDLDQVLGDHVRLHDPLKNADVDPATMRAEKGYGPEQAIDAQMLIGDSTDNIIGVLGVGPKKAAQLLQQYANVEQIIANADKLTPKLKENILAFRDRMEIVRQLVTLRKDTPIEFELARADVTRFAPASAGPILSELGLTKLLDRVSGVTSAARAPVPVPSPPIPCPPEQPEPPTFSENLFGDPPPARTAPLKPIPTPDSAPAPSGNLFDLVNVDTAASHYHLVDTPQALRDLATRLNQVSAFAFDTETTGLCAADVELVGISIAFEEGVGYYIPIRGMGKVVPADLVRELLGPIFTNPAIRKCGQNVKYDLIVLKCFGIEVAGVDFDTMIAAFVQDSTRRSFGIDSLAAEVLRYKKITTKELIGTGKKQVRFDELPTERVCTYASEDADIAWRLRLALEKRFTEPELQKLFTDLEMPLVEVLAQMELEGVAIDTDLLGRISNQLADRLVALERQIHQEAGRPFNINSTQQLATILFDERKLPVLKRTQTLRSTDAEVLEQLAIQTNDAIPKLLLEYRELSKLKSTYVDSLPEMVCKRTGRVHPSFHQTGAVTGRLSCSDPNLQNIPIRTELGAQIRRAFVPGSPDQVLLKADYSQIELRVLAHFSGDENLAAAFREDRDIHAFVASQLNGVPLEEVTKEQRARAKTVNFGIVYGQSAFGLARQTGMSQSEAKLFIERYFQRYPRIRGFLDECIAHARKHGYVKTLMGRRRAISDIESRNQSMRFAAERFAVNTVVQGTAADLIKLAMLNIHRRIQREKRPLKMILQVHDELVFEAPRKSADTQREMIVHEMSNAMQLTVPIKVDIAAGPNWLDVA
jgi:DNA polymerase-1